MAFKYRLEKLLKLKRIDEHRAVERLALCRDARDRCDQAVAELLGAYDETSRHLAAQDEGRSAMEYRLTAYQLQLLGERIRELLEKRLELEAELDCCRAETSERVCQRQAHERLRERALSQWRRHQRRLSQKKMDEAGAVSVRQAKREANGE